MSARSIRYRLNETNNIWPGFVDVLATLLIVIIFVLMIFTVSQIYLSDAISGRDKALENLRSQINELSKILVIEKKEKQQVLTSLEQTQDQLAQTESDLRTQEMYSQGLQSDIAKKESELFIQDQNILALSDQIKELLVELRIVAKALETYEGAEIASLNTEGLGERINKALATRIDQLNQLNEDLDEVNIALAQSETNLQNKINDLDIANTELALNKTELENKIEELNNLNSNLMSINESLGLGDADLVEQLAAIQKKNDELVSLNALLQDSQKETEQALKIIEQVNEELVLKDEALQEQIVQYQEITKDLLAINDSLGLEDASLIEQLEAIRSKNAKLAELNLNLVEKDNAIFSLRGKILELNNILALSEEKQLTQQSQIAELSQSLNLLKEEKTTIQEESTASIKEMKMRSTETLKQVAFLTEEIEALKNEIILLNAALEYSEQTLLTKELKIEVLGERLNKALTSKVFELQKYRSEFFGKLQLILGDRKDIKIVGDRFIFESELLFDSASANLQSAGTEKLKQIGLTLMDTTQDIPADIDWIIQVEGHTDKRSIKTVQYPSNWELSTARANSVLKLLLDLGFAPHRLSAAGYGEFYPLSDGDSDEDLQQNRRIELKLTSR
ncbi:MAG: OmpA family protein [Alphaproteobacteria bacterium]|nr:OmpA family protein [Alphaproteobacteria bacterium]